MTSLMARSEGLSFGPVWYHPTIFSFAATKRAPTDGVRLGRGQGGGEERWQLTVDLPEESPHVLEVVVVQEPDGGILVILFKGN